ncbi:hypothetical protein HG66A1_26210 [Gimesia chilikensis]|uniref:Uncharacterized protein n=1 Tax=Gimesia chilikensis TaxID=2605989 RepID=A0A517PN79_9PLAN|nr:hypothetical protein HG66A1_26210 [Gimesia chilikensis]
MRDLRNFRNEGYSLPHSPLYLSTNWKIGQLDKKHKDSKLLENEHSIEGGISLDKVVSIYLFFSFVAML